jgi:hypothetical protein
MKTPDEIQAVLRRRFQANRREWLLQAADGSPKVFDCWPLTLNLDIPSEATAFQHIEHVRTWAMAWQGWTGPGRIEWVDRKWSRLGSQRLPIRLILDTSDDVARCIGAESQWRRVLERARSILKCWPCTTEAIACHYQELAGYSDTDFARLTSFVRWLIDNRDSGLYPRQIPLHGIHTKWIENHKGILADLVTCICPQTSQTDRDVFGLRLLPKPVRIRILDPLLRSKVGGLCDIAAPIEQLASLELPVRRLFVVENIQTSLSFGELPESALIMGLGYGVDIISSIPWVHSAECIYWGDIDTHGLSILAKARTFLPLMRSVLMDRGTLLEFTDLWVEEPEQCMVESLGGLTEDEQELYQELRTNRWGNRVRLEQERIPWAFAQKRIGESDQ